MSFHLHKSGIIKNVAKVGGITFFSRILGIIREVFLVRFFGVGAMSDAFVAAFKLPNLFRHVFAEGAMSASFVPAFVKSVKEDDREASNGLMTISFLFFEGLVLLLSVFVFFKAEFIIWVFAPGFSPEQVAYAIPFLRVLFPFLFFVSSSSLIAGALQSVNHFFAPAFGTPLWNMVYIGALLLALKFNLSPMFVCGGILVGAAIQFSLHLYFYFKLNFNFGAITPQVKVLFRNVLTKFCPCLFGVSIVEANLLISGIFASYLPKGSMTLLYLGSRYMNIPLGVFAVALTSVLLPHFSRVVLYAPRRLNFYILEAAKLVTWVIVPVTLIMIFLSRPLFEMVLFSKNQTAAQVTEASFILIIYLCALLFLCLNKILLSVFYSMKDTTSTTIAAAASAVVNLAGDIVGIYLWGSYGIAAAVIWSAVTMTCMCFYFLRTKHGFRFYSANYFNFLGRYVVQLLLGGLVFIGGYYTAHMHMAWVTHWIGFWVFACTWSVAVMAGMYLTRKMFKLEVYFLNR